MSENNGVILTSRKAANAALDLARRCLDSGEEESARDLAMRACSSKSDDPEILAGWAGVFEGLGMARRALECYRGAIREAPENSGVMFKLALLLRETGHEDESVHYLKKVLARRPSHPEARRMLGEYFRTLGLEGQAQALVPAATPKGAGAPRRFPVTLSRRDIEIYLGLFSGKEVGYAIQRAREEDGAVVFDYTEGPLSSDLVLAHLRGIITLAAYPLRSDNSARYAAVSVKARGRVAKTNQRNPSFAPMLAEKARAHLFVLAGHAARAGIPAYPEDCGGIFLRLWFFFETFFHFLKIRKFVMGFLEHAPVPDGWLSIEPVLATRPTGLGWEENPVLLPLGVHRATLRRCFFLDSEGEPVAEQLKHLRRIRSVGPAAGLAESFGFGLPSRRISARSGEASVQMPASLRDLAAARSSVDRRTTSPQAMKIYRACAVIGELVDRALRGMKLRHEEKLALFYSFGMVEGGATAIHEALGNCPDYDREKVAKQIERLRHNPISCLKIRKLLPELASSVACCCLFDLRGGKYPCPVMHVNPHLVPTALEMTLPSDLPLKRVAERYIGLRRHHEETCAALERLEALLERGFARRDPASVKIGGVRLTRVENGGKAVWEIAHL